MFFLYDMFQDSNALNPTGNDLSINTLRISNGIFEQLNILNIISTATNVFDTTQPTEWTENTIINATFNDSLDGGSISDFIGYVDRLEIQRQEEGSNEWVTLQTIYKNQQTGEINATFRMEDSYGKYATKYLYQIVPVDSQGNVGTALQQDVLSIFNNAYIVDATHIYPLTNEYEIGSAQTNQQSAIYMPYGSKYPFVAFNAETKYDSGSITAVLLAPTSNSALSSFIDRPAQVKLVEEFNDWLTNGRAKIWKDFNGNFKVITVTDAVTNGYYKELGNGIASTTFNYTEVGDFTQEYLDRLGLTKGFTLENK